MLRRTSIPPRRYAPRRCLRAGAAAAAPLLLLVLRLAACLAPSFGGLSNRVAYGRSTYAIVRDALAVALENDLVLRCWEWALLLLSICSGGGVSHSGSSSSSRRRRNESPASTTATPRPRHRYCRPFVRLITATALTLCWFVASWGDYVFQAESWGLLPTLWLVAPGLRNPAVHVGVQFRTQRGVFLGGLYRVVAGMCAGMGFLCAFGRHRQHRIGGEGKVGVAGVGAVSAGKMMMDGNEEQEEGRRCYCDCCGGRADGEEDKCCRYRRRRRRDGTIISEYVTRTYRRVNLNLAQLELALLLLLFSSGSWAPLTNLAYCAFGSVLLTPPGGGGGSGSSNDRDGLASSSSSLVSARRNSIAALARAAAASSSARSADEGDLDDGRRRRHPRPPNVVLIVHESLGGSALRGRRGREAAPYYRTLSTSDPDFYDFRHARTVAGTTPLATPAILSGLLPYDSDCVDLIQSSSLGWEYGAGGYDTASFVSYGHDWRGGTWSIVEDVVRPGFGHVVGPKVVGEPLVNEYGMDDRRLVRYFRDWLLGSSSEDAAAGADLRREEGEYAGDDDDDDDGAGGDGADAGERRRRPRSPLRGEHGIDGEDGMVETDVEGDGGAATSDNPSSRRNASRPFFALVVFNNNHFPHLTHESYTGVPEECETDEAEAYYVNGERYSCTGDVGRYYSSIRTMDESLEQLMAALEAAGESDHTIVVGAGDHGETPNTMKRLWDVDAPILEVPMYLRVPGRLPLPRGARRRLRDNTNGTVSVLDIVPTLRDLLGYNRTYAREETELSSCVTGTSLLGLRAPEDRIVPGWKGPPLQGDEGQGVGVFSTRDEALVYYPSAKFESTSHVAEFKFDDDDPIFTLHERKLGELSDEERRRWAKVLGKGGWFGDDGHGGLVGRRMPRLEEVLLTGGRGGGGGDTGGGGRREAVD